MSEPTKTSAGHSIADLKALIKRDVEASKELQTRLEQLRQDIKDGKKLPKKKIDLMEISNKDMTKDLVLRIEQIEATDMAATDREMLQALNARLAVCDVQAMQLAELRELEHEARGEHHEFLEPEKEPVPLLHRSVSAPAAPETVEGEHAEGLALDEHATEDNPAKPRHNQAYYSDDDEYGHEIEDDVSEKSVPDIENWPAPYRVLKIHPDTPDDEIEDLVKKYVGLIPSELLLTRTRSTAALAAKHDPRRLPNDADAPTRWAVIEKSRDVLLDVEKRRYLARHQKEPAGLEDLDFDKLGLN